MKIYNTPKNINEMLHLLTKIAISTEAYGAYSTLNSEEDAWVEFLSSRNYVKIFPSETNHSGKYCVCLTPAGKAILANLQV